MDDVTIREAKEKLEELIERAARGEDVRIVDPEHGAVRLVPADHSDTRPARVVFGQWKGRMAEIPPERLLAPLTAEELAWLSGENSPAD
jgi:prevent-host-death family protein